MVGITDFSQKKSHTMEIYSDAYYEINNYLNQSSTSGPDFSKPQASRKLISLFKTILCQMGFKKAVDWLWDTFLWYYYRSDIHHFAIRTMFGTAFHGLTESQKFDEVFYLLGDNRSKAVFNWFIKYRFAYMAIGPIAAEIFPPVDFENHNNRKLTKRIGNICKIGRYAIKYWQDLSEVEKTWIYEQYLLSGRCEPQTGEVALDAGGFQGETAIWLADKVGEMGKVYSFEPLASNCRKMERNVRRNHLDNVIQVVNQGLWDDNTRLLITDNGLASTCSAQHGVREISAVTLDSYIENEIITRVDFVKMDIEGAELRALKGAAGTIKRFKPKLAVCVYHLPEDIYEIPVFIKSLVPEYKLYLSHKCPGWHDTVLFACVD